MRSALLRYVVLGTLLVLLAACRAARPSDLPRDEDWIVAVKSARLASSSAWFKRFAHHTWIDAKRGSEAAWERHECLGGALGIAKLELPPAEARDDHRFGGASVRVLGVVTGDDARRAIEHVDSRASELAAQYADGYRAWPGPNSNTFVAEIARGVPELAFVFDPNAVGKDYEGWFGAGLTASKTGVRVDTPIVGAAVGLREGVELHLLQLTLGVSFDPPGLSLPFLPQIPFGWSSAPNARLHPSDVGASRVFELVDDAPERRLELGALPEKGAWLVERASGDATVIEFAVGPCDERGARSVELSCWNRGDEALFRVERTARLDASRVPVEQILFVGDGRCVLELALDAEGRATAALRLHTRE